MDKQCKMIFEETKAIEKKGLNVRCECCGEMCYHIATGDNEGDCCRCNCEHEGCELCHYGYALDRDLCTVLDNAKSVNVKHFKKHDRIIVISENNLKLTYNLRNKIEDFTLMVKESLKKWGF